MLKKAPHLFFYIADETGNQTTMGSYEPSSRGPVLLASGSHEEIGDWELHLRSEDNLEIHRAGFKSMSMHNLSDLVQQAVATNAIQTGNLNLPDITEDSSNIMVYQIDSRQLSVGRAALSSLLGGVGYFYGQSKVAIPKGFTAMGCAYISMDIIGHWLDLLNSDGWIPREQILGAEALSKVPEEFVLQYPSNGNPPTLFLAIRDLASGIHAQQFSDEEAEKDYYKMSNQLSDFGTLNKLHLDDKIGAYFDYGNHTEKARLRWFDVKDKDTMRREFLRETLQPPQLQLVPHVGYVSLFPFMMGTIPPESWVLEKQLNLISNTSILWTDYGLRSLSRTSSIYMKRNTEHDPPYWRGAIWINMNYMVLSTFTSLCTWNIVQNYDETGFFWENYDQKNKGKGKGARSFTGWTSLIVLIMAESYPTLHR
ncbi:unnamed protein product [Miscanthus lutarioriparius]|uniref:Glycosyl hydrolase family 63 C-terminal domain-containing protein n=1 Tax=Miscanthus lutarioriparius TaxID=422564 RepID=A0A811P6S7_9POAL|nr:unnamed protein product [Miscanthus lutarioriparius]